MTLAPSASRKALEPTTIDRLLGRLSDPPTGLMGGAERRRANATNGAQGRRPTDSQELSRQGAHSGLAKTFPAGADRLEAPAGATRRAFVGGGLAAAAWSLAPARAETPAPPPDGFRTLGAAPHPFAFLPPPAEPAATLAYGGTIPGPLLRLKKGEELKLRFSNTLANPTTLSFAGLRMANAVAGYGGLTGPRLAPGASAELRFVPPDSGFNLYLPHAGATDAAQQGRGLFGPIVVDEADKMDVDEDVVVLLSDWNFDDKGGIKDDFADPAIARRPAGAAASCSPTAPPRRFGSRRAPARGRA